jgi:hypothetical protein
MDELEEQLCQSIAKICEYPLGSKERQVGLTQILRTIVRSGRLWRDDSPYYEEALQHNWVYFCRHLCFKKD